VRKVIVSAFVTLDGVMETPGLGPDAGTIVGTAQEAAEVLGRSPFTRR